MREFKKHKSRRAEITTFCLHTLGVLVLLMVTLAVMRAAWDMYGKLTRATAGQAAAEAELATLQVQQERIAASVDELSSSRGVEAQIRQRYGVAKPGEGEIEIVRDAPASTSPAKAAEHWWQGIFRALFVW